MIPPSDKLLAELLLEVKQLRAEISQLRQQPTHAPIEQWAIGSEAWQHLRASGIRSPNHLKRLRQEGVFSELKGEIRNVSQGDRPTWEYNIPKCHDALKRYFDRLSA
jgi:hypothetical protein